MNRFKELFEQFYGLFIKGIHEFNFIVTQNKLNSTKIYKSFALKTKRNDF